MMLSSGNFLQNYDSELLPLKFELIILIDSDFELPGLPIIKIGILFMIHIRVVKTFYRSEKLIAIL